MFGSTLWIIAGSFVVSAVIAVVVLRSVGVLGPRKKVLSNGTPGTATILGVTPTGTVVNEINYVCRLQLRVRIPGQPEFDVETKETVPITAMGMLTVGSVVSVRVDPADRTKTFVDFRAGVQPAGMMPAMAPPSAAAVAAAVADPSVAAGVPSGSAADLLARGQRATGVLKSFADTGQTPRSLGRPAQPGGEDDPIFVLTVDLYFASGSAPIEGMVMHRVPRNMVPYLRIGMNLACAVDPGNPSRSFAVDWAAAPKDALR